MKKNTLITLILFLTSVSWVFPQDIIFEDDFESYTVGAFPSAPWYLKYNGSGIGNQIIVDDHFVSPTQSLMLECSPNWAAAADVQLLHTPSIIFCEGYLKAEHESGGPNFGFQNPDIGPWGTAYATVWVCYDGNIMCNNQILQTGEPNKWYHIRIKYDSYLDLCDVWIDGILKGTGIACSTDGEYTILRLSTYNSSNVTKGWYDNIKVYADDGLPPVINSIKDVPNDQGKKVQIAWNKSKLDVPNISTPITTYSIWRLDEVTTFITQIPAVQIEQYSVIAPTLFDSCETSCNYSNFQVIAHTDNPWIYLISDIDSGYSINNYASLFVIDERDTKINLSLYPNPAYQEVNISTDGGREIDEASIYTLTGQQVLQKRPVNGTVDISVLQPGMYIVEVNIENTRIRQKLLVQR